MNTATPPKLAFVTDTGCDLHVDISPRETATLHSLGEDGTGKFEATVLRSLPPGPNRMYLNPGLYHLQVQYGASCSVIGGQCSIVAVTDGEDPWPTPPQAPIPSQLPPTAGHPPGASPATPGRAFLVNHQDEVRTYFSRVNG
jgi:hypothetical protein